MSGISLNPEALSRFKEKTDYPLIVQKLPQDDLNVVMDWERLLSSIHVNDGEWIAEDRSTFILAPFHAESSVTLENDDEDIELDIHVFGNHSNRDVLDQALVILSRTSMTDINMAYDINGPCDVYFHTIVDSVSQSRRAVCVFRNVIAEVNVSTDEVDVRKISDILYWKMKQALKQKGEVNQIAVFSSAPTEVVAIGDDFSINIELEQNEDYLVDLHHDFKDVVEWLGREKNRFNFRALKPGIHTITISIVHPKTLVSSSVMQSITLK